MEIHFLGVGEACDGSQPNTAILLRTGAEQRAGRILLDCGFSVPHRFFALEPSPDELEMLWLSHFHGDHFFGAPLLLLWSWEMGRKKPLHILGPPGVKTKIMGAMELAYPNFMPRLGFPLVFVEIEPGGRRKIADSVWQAAYTEHSQPCLSLRVELQGKAIFYSGDGRPTTMTQTLAAGSDIIIHEAYGIADTTPGHGSIGACLDFACSAGVPQIALVHMQRDVQPQSQAAIASLRQKYPALKILLPGAGSRIAL